MKHVNFPWLTTISAIVILIAVALPSSSIPLSSGIPNFDKIIHFLMFFILATAIKLEFNPIKSKLILTIIIVIIFSCLTEVLQLFVDGRSGELFDILADAAGAICGFVISNITIKAITTFCSYILRRSNESNNC